MIKAILFDKDGTLIEFNSLWINSTYAMIHELVNMYADHNHDEKSNEISLLVGLNGINVSEHSVLASKSTEDISGISAQQLGVEHKLIHEKVNQFYYDYVSERRNEIKGIGNLVPLFQQLKSKQLAIGVVTADNYDITALTLNKLGINKYVDFIATADRYKKKPDIEAMQAFCNLFNIEKEEVVHIGDTLVDMEFSKHGKYGVGVLSGVGTEETLRKYTSYILPSVQELIDEHGNLILRDL